MYIVGRYYQGNPDQKPEQWGTVADVQYAVRHWCEEWIGVNYEKLILAMPLWGNAKDYSLSSNHGTVNAGKFDKDGFVPGVISSPIRLKTDVIFNNTTDYCSVFTILTASKFKAYDLFCGDNTAGSYLGFTGNGAKIRFQNYSRQNSEKTINAQKNKKLSIVYNQLPELGIYPNDTEFFINAKTTGIIDNANTNDPRFVLNTIGNGYNGTTYIFEGIIHSFCVFNSLLNTDQINKLNDQPYKLFEPVSRPLYFDFTDLPAGSLDFIFNANNTSILNTTINLQRNNLINIENTGTVNTIDNNTVRNSTVDVQNMSAIDSITSLLSRYCTIDVQNTSTVVDITSLLNRYYAVDVQNMSVIDSITSLLNRHYTVDVQNMSTVANIVSLLNRYYTVDVQNTFVIDNIISLLNRYYTIGVENLVSIEDILISTSNILYFSLSLENGLTIPDTYLYKNINYSIEPTNNSTIDSIVFSVIRCLELDLLNNTPIDTIVYNVIRTINMSLENTEYILDIPIFIEELINILEINGFIKEVFSSSIKEIFTGNIKEIYNGTIN